MDNAVVLIIDNITIPFNTNFVSSVKGFSNSQSSESLTLRELSPDAGSE
jgi:hypothetical protein